MSGSALEYSRYGPFGAHGAITGENAIDLLGELMVESSESPAGTPEWDSHDRFSFESLREIVVNSRFIEPEPEMDGADVADLHRVFTRLYCAVPFSEAERGWLLGGASNAPYTAEDLVGVTAEIMSSGVRQVVHGRELVRRWWAWRRGTQEYATQDSLAEAKLTLGGLGRTLVIAKNRTAEQAAILRCSGH